MRAWWSSYKFIGTPSFILACKLKALKQDLKKWNLEVFGHIDNQKSTLLEELQELEGKALLGDTSEEVLLRKGMIMTTWREFYCQRRLHGVKNPGSFG